MKQLLTFVLLLLASTGWTQDKASTTFATYDVFLDSKGEALAAWQFELTYDKDKVQIVGLEGGGRAPFPPDKPPRHDPKGLRAGRILVAAFTTAKDGLPTGKFRVARLHLRIIGKDDPDLSIKLITAATRGAKKITASITLTRREEQ